MITGLQGKAPPSPPGIALPAGSVVGTWLLGTSLELEQRDAEEARPTFLLSRSSHQELMGSTEERARSLNSPSLGCLLVRTQPLGLLFA